MISVNYLYLAVAISCEVIGTSALKASDGFSKLRPTLLMALCFAVALFCLSQTLRTIPLGIAYAIWCGAGIILTALSGWFVFRQSLDLAAITGMALIIAGVLVINLMSKSVAE
ncbi:MAG: small multidrug resistance pump [Methylobacteriaceae bacterium]|jgi:small multidrug resistance pump|nr:small multidrug resistance pump [Methylobacteriaceae bacterium]